MPPARRIRNPVTMEDPARRHQQIQTELSQIGLVLPGSLTDRTTRCQRAGCHCHANPPQLHGPYPTWTRKAGARSITKTLTPQEAERLRPYFAAHLAPPLAAPAQPAALSHSRVTAMPTTREIFGILA